MVFLYVHKRDRKKTWYKIISMHLMLWCNYTSTSFECHTFNIIRTYIISDDYCRLQHSITDTIHYQYAYRLQTYECSAKLCWQIFKFHAKRTVQQTHTHTSWQYYYHQFHPSISISRSIITWCSNINILHRMNVIIGLCALDNFSLYFEKLIQNIEWHFHNVNVFQLKKKMTAATEAAECTAAWIPADNNKRM